MEKNKAGGAKGSDGRKIGATADNLSRGHSRTVAEQQQAGAHGQHSQQQSEAKQPGRGSERDQRG